MQLPLTDLRGYRPRWLARDLAAALAVTVLSIPQGVAYALIAGLPPAAGLYAATIPALVGSLFRSSRHVIAGPTNAVSLLVGGAVAALALQTGASVVQVAVTLAFMVGVFQVSAGLLRLGAVVDYISNPVVLGYITGAAGLIAVGQLGNLTHTAAGSGDLFHRLITWAEGAGALHPMSLTIGLATVGLYVVIGRLDRRLPAAAIVMGLGIALTLLFDLRQQGVRVVADLAPVPASLPPLTLPDLTLLSALAPVAFATMVLSLVESSAVARNIAAESGDHLNMSEEFVGQGLANFAAAFCGGYPVSGSLSRSVLNWRVGARSRLSGVFAALFVVAAVLLAGPIIDFTPVSCLAGLLLVVAWDLVDVPRIRLALRSGLSDRLGFLATLIGAWTLTLDQAIYLGVGISLVLFLRRARLLVVRPLVVDPRGRLREASDDDDDDDGACPTIRVLHIEGSLFFGSAGELRDALEAATADPTVQALVVRVKRTRGMDFTTAEVFQTVAASMEEQGRHLLMVGMRPETFARMLRIGAAEAIGHENLFPTQAGWFVAMDEALATALDRVGPHEHEGDAECPIRGYLAGRSLSAPSQRSAV